MEMELSDVRSVLATESARRRRATFQLRAVVAGVLILSLATEAFRWSQGKDPDFMSSMSLLFLLVGGVAIGAQPALKLSAKTAATLGDPQCLGYVLEIIDSGDPELVAVAEETLRNALPNLTPDDAGFFDAHQRRCLTQLMTTSNKPEVVGAALAALRQIGLPGELAALEQIAKGSPHLKAEEKDKMANLARMAMADVRMRAARDRIEAETPSAGISWNAPASSSVEPPTEKEQAQGTG